tara:strand:+ start:449 stop:577 length:129 start_codon:yes stop_codon:yes gene_type:complete
LSTRHHEERLETILEEVMEAFPFYSHDKQEEIAKRRFEEELV